MVDATPPTIAISPTGTITAVSPPTITVQWCDAEGGFLAHTVTLDGVSLPDVFAASSAPGCAGAGTSTYPNVSMVTGAHTVGASATDAAGHVSTTSASITYSLPALSDFRPEVTPKNLSMDVFTGISAQRTFTVRNAGVANASYQLAAVCPSVACQVSKASTTLAVGATDSAVVTFTPTSSMGPSATVGLRATYTDAASHTIADTGSVVATLAQMASHAVPSLTPLAPTMTVEPGVTTSYYFVLRNTGTVAATYDFSSVTAGGFSWPQGWAVFDSRQPRARAAERAGSRAGTIGAGLRDAGEPDFAERLGSNHAHRNLPCVGWFGVERQRIDTGLYEIAGPRHRNNAERQRSAHRVSGSRRRVPRGHVHGHQHRRDERLISVLSRLSRFRAELPAGERPHRAPSSSPAARRPASPSVTTRPARTTAADSTSSSCSARRSRRAVRLSARSSCRPAPARPSRRASPRRTIRFRRPRTARSRSRSRSPTPAAWRRHSRSPSPARAR